MSDIAVRTVADTEGYIVAVGIDTGTDTLAADCSDIAADRIVAGYMAAGYTVADHYIDYLTDPFL